MVIHPEAPNTVKIRQEIQALCSRHAQKEQTKQYHVTSNPIPKRQNREGPEDRSHGLHPLQTMLSQGQDALVAGLRKLLLLPLDHLMVITREFIHPQESHSGIHRTLQRPMVSNLQQLEKEQAETEGKPPGKRHKVFKDYAPGFVHADVKYPPRMQDEVSNRYLLVATDRASRWLYMEIHKDKSARSAQAFMLALIKKAPFRIDKILTDNGRKFTDRFISNSERMLPGKHLLNQMPGKQGWSIA